MSAGEIQNTSCGKRETPIAVSNLHLQVASFFKKKKDPAITTDEAEKWCSYDSLQLYLATTCLEGVQADVSHKGKISCQKSKRVKAEGAALAVNCDWGRPDNAALFACMRDRYIVLLFTSGTSAPSFRAPNTFWLE